MRLTAAPLSLATRPTLPAARRVKKGATVDSVLFQEVAFRIAETEAEDAAPQLDDSRVLKGRPCGEKEESDDPSPDGRSFRLGVRNTKTEPSPPVQTPQQQATVAKGGGFVCLVFLWILICLRGAD